MADTNILNKLKNRDWRIDSGMYRILTAKRDEEKNPEDREAESEGRVALKSVPYRRNPIQRYLDSIHHPRRLVPKARQLGITTHAAIDTLDLAMFHKNYKAAIIANNGTLVRTLFEDKIRFPYQTPGRPELIDFEAIFPYKYLTKTNIAFHHDSEVSVRTAATGLTLNKLHISELGKLDQDYPDRAKELIQTSLPALPPGANVTIESTADAGPRGEFYRLCQDAAEMQKAGIEPGPDDFVMIFFGWYLDPNYRIEGDIRPIPAALKDYFKELQMKHGIRLDDGQKQFYFSKWRTLGGAVYRQFPSTWEECFLMNQRGIIYADEMAQMDLERRIDTVPIRPELPVDTWWDLGIGRSDQCVIIFTQTYPNGMIAIVDYIEDSLKGMAHYSRELKTRNYNYGYHVAPWDIVTRNQGSNGVLVSQWTVAKNLGIKFEITPRWSISDGIEATRNMFSRFVINRERCGVFVQRLRNYRYFFDEEKMMFTGSPVHDINSHACDALRVLGVCHDTLMSRRALTRSRANRKEQRPDMMGALT